ncbi:hypothetical protein ACFL3T_03445 [Patescibacteria group bacterium]
MTIIPEYPSPEEEAMRKAAEKAEGTAEKYPNWRKDEAQFKAMCDDMFAPPVRDRAMETIEDEE